MRLPTLPALPKIAALALAVLIVTITLGAALPASAQGGIPVTTLDLVNLRSGPGTKFDSLAKIPANTALTAVARNEAGVWLYVNYNGVGGWLAIRFLNVGGDVNALPIGAPAPAAPPPPADPNAIPTPNFQNGAIVSIYPYAQTDATDYYRIVYISDGMRISGFMAEPRREGRFPAMIYNRGGNRGVGALKGDEFVPLAEAGFVVVASQYRGGPGSEGWDNLGGGDVNDVLALIDLLATRPKADTSRIGMFGTSRGGLMTYIALKRLAEQGRNPIRAAVTTSGLTDLFMWAKENPDLNNGAYQDLVGGTTTSHPQLFKDRSATYWAGLIRAPLMIIHGTADNVVSADQAKALYNKMRAAGRSVQLNLVFGGDHGLTNADYGYPTALSFFQPYFGNWDFEFIKPAMDRAYTIIRAGM